MKEKKKRKRTSQIWLLPKNKFEKVVKQSNSIAEIIRYFGFAEASSIYRMIKQRCSEDDIDYSHIKLGLNSNKGRKFFGKVIPLEKVMIENSTYCRKSLKKRLLENGMLKNECAICNQQPIHNNKKLVMVLDHINGIRNDNRLENLRLLCPNCNSQQDTFAGKNNKKEKKKFFCKNCGDEHCKGTKSGLCKKCYYDSDDFKQKMIKMKEKLEKIRKIKNRPSKEELIELIKIIPLTKIGEKFGVSGNTIRKWAKSYDVDTKDISPFSCKH